MKVTNPSFVLDRLSSSMHSLSKCFMPEENNVYLSYIFAEFPLLSVVKLGRQQCCGSEMFVPDPRSDLFPSRIPDSHQRI
jgi:hypothetical protein